MWRTGGACEHGGQCMHGCAMMAQNTMECVQTQCKIVLHASCEGTHECTWPCTDDDVSQVTVLGTKLSRVDVANVLNMIWCIRVGGCWMCDSLYNIVRNVPMCSTRLSEIDALNLCEAVGPCVGLFLRIPTLGMYLLLRERAQQIMREERLCIPEIATR